MGPNPAEPVSLLEEGTETQTRTEATTVVYKPRREDSKEIHTVATWFSDVKLPNCEKINFCCLSRLFDGTLLGQPFQSRTPRFHTSSKLSHRNFSKITPSPSSCPVQSPLLVRTYASIYSVLRGSKARCIRRTQRRCRGHHVQETCFTGEGCFCVSA